jgi:asparagine synthase (glutamine-hydrolysing)
LDRVGVNRSVALELLQEHTQRKVDHARTIWTLIVLSEWLEWLSDIEAENYS